MPYQDIDGIRFHYEDHGPRQGRPKPVIFVHGFSVSGEVFEPQAVALSGDYRVISLDERGCGQSDRPMDGYEIAKQSEDLRAFIQELNLQHPVLVGHSIGAAIVMEYLI